MANDALQKEILQNIPPLRAFAASLTGNLSRADDLVEETLMRAMADGTSRDADDVQAWLFGVLRNHFYSDYRKRRRDTDEARQGGGETEQFNATLSKLPAEQREALILVAGSGLAYEEVAKICGCAVGTIKSRVNRARNRLSQLMSSKSQDPNSDRPFRPVMAAGGRY